MRLHTHSVEQTLALGKLLGQLAPPNTLIALHGQLGAGKTHLTRGIALGAAVDDPDLVSSPTYVLLNVYPGPKPVYHLDAYRIASSDDFAAVGFDELLSSSGLIIVEWPERILDLLPPDYLHILIQHEGADAFASARSFQLTSTGPRSKLLLDSLLDAWPPPAFDSLTF